MGACAQARRQKCTWIEGVRQLARLRTIRPMDCCSAAAPTDPVSPAQVGLILLCTRILVEPLDGTRPCLFCSGLVVAFRSGVIEEAVHGIWIDMAFIADVVFLQFRLL